MASVDRLLAEQIAYYRARAPEYDEWFRREGRYDRGSELAEVWQREVDEVAVAFDALPLDGANVLELAPGSGIWTERYAERASSITAVDASPEMIDLARARLGSGAANIDFVLADIFEWQPPRRYDVVVMCFWISHVPQALMHGFLRMVATALAPGGVVFFVDARDEATSQALDHPRTDTALEVQLRRLNDGREFRIVKNYWRPAYLRSRFQAAGLTATVLQTSTYFLYGHAAA